MLRKSEKNELNQFIITSVLQDYRTKGCGLDDLVLLTKDLPGGNRSRRINIKAQLKILI